jgi:hypothetical protein
VTTVLTTVELIAKAGVAVVLLSSGYAKLAGPPSDAQLGLPRALAWLDRAEGRLTLGSLELAVGAASLLALGSPVVDSLALALCTAFFVGSAILGMTRPGTACQCFGAASASAFGAHHTLWTGVLAATAAIAFVGSLDGAGTSAWSWHPLMLVTLVGVVALASRVRTLPDPTGRRRST